MYHDSTIPVKISFMDTIIGENEKLKRQLLKASALLDFMDKELETKKENEFKKDMNKEGQTKIGVV